MWIDLKLNTSKIFQPAGSVFAPPLGLLVSVLIGWKFLFPALGHSQDWPMWRYDSSRTASSENSLPESVELKWSIHHSTRRQAWDDPLNLDLMTYDRIFEPIVLNGIVVVPFNDESKVVAYRLEDGVRLWTFFTEGPVRLPPAGVGDKVCFCSDDGHLYCVDVFTGKLVWKFFGGPNSQHALGNRRLISAWPARGGPVIREGKVYFSASIWPFMGVFIYSLDMESGELVWVNDQTGSSYIKQPHSAPSFAGVAPQGAFVATEKHLIVPGGRSVPAVFNRTNGSLLHFELNAGGKGNGGSFVAAQANRYFVHTRGNGTREFSMQDGTKRDFAANQPVLHNAFLYTTSIDSDGRSQVLCYDKNNQQQWSVMADGSGDLIRAGVELVAAGNGVLTRIRLPEGGASARIDHKFEIPSDTERLLVADKTLVLITASGSIHAYHDRSSSNGKASMAEVAIEAGEDLGAADQKKDRKESGQMKLLLEDLNFRQQEQGYALWFGNATDDSLKDFILHTEYEQVAVVDPSESNVSKLRSWLDAKQLHGRVTVHCSTAKQFAAPSYIASCVMMVPDSSGEIDIKDVKSAYQSVRPYGGCLIVSRDALKKVKPGDLSSTELEQAEVSVETYGTLVRRVGKLPGSADWTHQYGDVANTIKSDDSRVKLPLGVLWFGGSSHLDVLPRHGHGPPEQVVGGRLFIQGIDCLSARDVYTGRVLWKRTFEDLGTYGVYYDSTFDDAPLNPKYNQVHIPGANGRGTNYVVTEDRVYVAAQDRCYVLDPSTGSTLDTIRLPDTQTLQSSDQAEDTRPEWGYLAVYQDVLIGGVEFANYQQQMGLVYEGDAKLSRSRAGFGGKSVDRAASRSLVGFNRHTGELLWQVQSKYSFWHNGIVAGGEQIYCLDRYPMRVEQALMRRGRSKPDSYRIAALDHRTGEVVWEINEGVFGSWLSYSEEFDLLLQAGAAASDRLTDEVSKGMAVYRAGDGSLKWRNDQLRYTGPCILHHDWIITNTNAYADSAGAYFLHDGHQKMVPNPITGELKPWHLNRAYGCNHIIASENMLTFRSGAAGYYDLLGDGGTGNFGGFKSGCTSNLVVANGVLNAPDYTRTCSCAYQNQTSLALVHMPEVELWSVDDFAVGESLKQPIRHLGINFGAPGDRRDNNGNLWLEYPVVAGDSPNLEIQWNSEASLIQRHASSLDNNVYRWIYASGLKGVTNLDITLADNDNDSLKAEDARYRVSVFLASSSSDSPCEVELTLQGQKRRQHVGTVDPNGRAAYQRVEFSRVSLTEELSLAVLARSGEPIIAGIEFKRE